MMLINRSKHQVSSQTKLIDGFHSQREKQNTESNKIISRDNKKSSLQNESLNKRYLVKEKYGNPKNVAAKNPTPLEIGGQTESDQEEESVKNSTSYSLGGQHYILGP